MPKVKMSDVKSGSQNVKEIFKLPMSSRTSKKLSSLILNDDELIEIFNISNDIEYHKDARTFYQRIIKSQKGPFNAEVFNLYTNNVFEVDSLMHLLELSRGINDEEKCRWITYAMATSATWFLSNFFMNGNSKSFGIDPIKKPFSLTLIEKIARTQISMNQIGDFFFGILDTLSDEEQYDWYIHNVASIFEKQAVSILTSYPNTSEKVLMHYYIKSFNNVTKEQLCKHKNMSINIKMEMYEKTGNTDLLPNDVTDILLF